MRTFLMNGYVWHVERVPPDSKELIDRTGTMTVATTDPTNLTIYLSEELTGSFAKRVLAHEMGHAAVVSYGLMEQIRAYCRPEHRIDMEEMMCNFVADYGEQIFDLTYQIIGDEALMDVPIHLKRLIS